MGGDAAARWEGWSHGRNRYSHGDVKSGAGDRRRKRAPPSPRPAFKADSCPSPVPAARLRATSSRTTTRPAESSPGAARTKASRTYATSASFHGAPIGARRGFVRIQAIDSPFEGSAILSDKQGEGLARRRMVDRHPHRRLSQGRAARPARARQLVVTDRPAGTPLPAPRSIPNASLGGEHGRLRHLREPYDKAFQVTKAGKTDDLRQLRVRDGSAGAEVCCIATAASSATVWKRPAASIYCCEHCAGQHSVKGLKDRVDGQNSRRCRNSA